MRVLRALILVVVASLSGPIHLSAQRAVDCEASKAGFVVGQRYSPEVADRAARAAGAREVRKIAPGGSATTDLQDDRLNLHVDDQETVRRVICG